MADAYLPGLVMLAADTTQPMHETAVRVACYLADLATGPGADEAVSTMVRQAASVADPFLTPDTPSELLTLGISAAYWLDLRAYDPVAPGRQTGSPDADPSREEGLPSDRRRRSARLAARFGGRPEVTIRIHKDANHLFFAGSGQSTPGEYARPGQVDPAVVDEIATWLARG